jgi:hypothetical protein
MKQLSKWLALLAMIFAVLKMADAVWWIPDYRGGNAYVSCSPDGRYKALLVHTAENTADAGSAQIIFERDHSVPVYIMRFPRDWYFTGRFSWSCSNNANDHCAEYTEFRLSYEHPITLPPTLWQRLHAWLTVKIRRLDNPDLTEKYDYDRQGHCSKFWNSDNDDNSDK